MFSSLVPLYNASIWIVKLIFNNVFLDALMANVETIKTFGLALGSLCKNTALELTPFISSVAVQCDYARDGDMCYEPGNGRTIDFIKMMVEVRKMATSTSIVLMSMCGSASGIFNIVLYPFMDINFAKGIHNIANSILYIFVQVKNKDPFLLQYIEPDTSFILRKGPLRHSAALQDPRTPRGRQHAAVHARPQPATQHDGSRPPQPRHHDRQLA